jgi:hypothetical protein
MIRLRTHHLAAAALLPLLGCFPPSTVPPPSGGPRVLLEEDFEGENDNRYKLNYTDFARWEVAAGTVDLVGTPPFDDFLSPEQGMYVDLDGTGKAAGTLRTKERFELAPGRYRLRFRMAGTPRPGQPANTVIVSVGTVFRETITLASYAPLETFTRTFRVRRPVEAALAFRHLGGDDYGIFIDDIRFERL